MKQSYCIWDEIRHWQKEGACSCLKKIYHSSSYRFTFVREHATSKELICDIFERNVLTQTNTGLSTKILNLTCLLFWKILHHIRIKFFEWKAKINQFLNSYIIKTFIKISKKWKKKCLLIGIAARLISTLSGTQVISPFELWK